MKETDQLKMLSESIAQIEETGSDDQGFLYRMLGRLQSDCEYFLGAGNGSERQLWAGNVNDQIEEMKKIFNQLEVKPEWITLAYIENYEKAMNAATRS
jgi:hypothetical protein